MVLDKTVIVFDKGNNATHSDWIAVHSAFQAVIGAMVNPPTNTEFALRRKRHKRTAAGKITSQWERNGVTEIKRQFLNRLRVQGWTPEKAVDLVEYFHALKNAPETLHSKLKEFPAMNDYAGRVTNKVGEFDFFLKTPSGKRVAVEWETGNVSSSHRSLNKLCLCMMAGLIEFGVLILPTRKMYEHLTDRVGNFEELSPYLAYWNHVGNLVETGLLAVIAVEHDRLSDMDDDSIPYINMTQQGRAEAAAEKLK